MKRGKILIIKRKEKSKSDIAYLLGKEGYYVESSENYTQAMEEIEKVEFDIALIDLKRNQNEGMNILKSVKMNYPLVEVIVLVDRKNISMAIESMKEGAYNYIPLPFKIIDEVKVVIRKAIEKKKLRKELAKLKKNFETYVDEPFIIGKSPEMLNINERIDQVASTDCNILIAGETGTGKELVAHAIHYHSKRRDKKILPFNCGAYNEELCSNELFGHDKEAFTGALSTKIGLFEAVDGGTLFLDEIGNMPISMQIKMLRVIQEKILFRLGSAQPIPIDARIIAATNHDLNKMIENGEFRHDLFYRLNVVSFNLPPLREKKDDIPLLSQHFLRKYSNIHGKLTVDFDDEVIDILMEYDYPGNVRELEHIIERAIILSNDTFITIKELPKALREISSKTYHRPNNILRTLKEHEKEYIKFVLSKTKGNKTEAAKILGVDRVSLWRKIKTICDRN